MTIFVASILICIPLGILFWLIGLLLAPSGTKISLRRGIAAAGLLTLWLVLSQQLLEPLVGNWRLLADFAATVAIGIAFFRLQFFRSVLLAILFWAAFTTVFYFLVFRPIHQKNGVTGLTEWGYGVES